MEISVSVNHLILYFPNRVSNSLDHFLSIKVLSSANSIKGLLQTSLILINSFSICWIGFFLYELIVREAAQKLQFKGHPLVVCIVNLLYFEISRSSYFGILQELK